MGEVISLKKARKERDRAAKEAAASGNRARFGRTKGEKARQGQQDAADRARLDGHRLDGGDDGSER
jgi:hypothetical protein